MPLTIPARHTLDFVRRFLPAAPVTVVEVGAGAGELAAALIALGHSVLPIDSDPDAVLTMRTRGLDGVLASWPDYVSSPAHTVMFSRSLHHLPVAAAVKHARSILRPDGRIIVEDFAFADMPETALSWLRGLLLRLTGQGVLQTPSQGFLAEVLAGADLRTLNAGDHHEVASAEAMRASLLAEGALIHESRVAYFYRYLLAGLSDAPTSHQVLEQVLHEETQAIRTGALWPLGRRWVVSP
jgi:SAM-dependent methyltransferase